jgi:hypothetical protein
LAEQIINFFDFLLASTLKILASISKILANGVYFLTDESYLKILASFSPDDPFFNKKYFILFKNKIIISLSKITSYHILGALTE